MSDYDNVMRRLDKLRNNYLNLVNQNNALTGKNRQLWYAFKGLHRDFEGLKSNPKVEKIIKEDAIEFSDYVKQFEDIYKIKTTA